MNTKHTPGPWRIGDAGLTIFGPKTDHPAPVSIVELPGPTPRVSASERRANARLIAKAPELLAALVRLTAWADVAGCDREPGSVLDSNIKAARAVIAQATAD